MASDNSKVNLITQILSAAAVVLSLVFVGLEVRESARQTAESARQTALNTQAVQVNAYQELIGQIVSMNQLNLERPEQRLLLNSKLTYEELSIEEQLAATNSVMMRLRYGDLAFYQYQLGMLSEERLDSAVGPLRTILCGPIPRRIWSDLKGNFVSGYRDFVDSNLRDEGC